MKILVCSSTYQGVTHGPAKFVQLIMKIKELYPEHEIRLLTIDIDEPVPNKIYKFDRSYPRFIGAFWEYWDNNLIFKHVKSIRSEYEFDVLLFADAVLGNKSARRYKGSVRSVGLINDDEYINNRFSAIKPTKEWLIKWKSRLLETRASKNLDVVVGNSDFICRKLIEEYRLPKKKVKKLYKSINIENFQYRGESSINLGKRIRIFFVKNDYMRGGLQILAEALGSIPNHTFEVFVAGPHDHQKAIVDSYFTGKENLNYHFLGKISQSQVIQHLEEDDILCVPALREGLGVANIEGLAKGIPVVSTIAGGIPEVLGGGEFGWMAKPNDAHDLAATIMDCLQNEEERKLKSEKGRKFVEEQFSHVMMIENLLKILKA